MKIRFEFSVCITHSITQTSISITHLYNTHETSDEMEFIFFLMKDSNTDQKFEHDIIIIP